MRRFGTTLEAKSGSVHLRSWTVDGENVFVTEVTTDSKSVPLRLCLSMPAPDSVPHTTMRRRPV